MSDKLEACEHCIHFPQVEKELAALRSDNHRMRDYLEGIMAIAGNPNAIAACRLIIKEAQAALGKDADK